MKLIIGLGNPGEKYERTRHNIGFMVLERFLKDFKPIRETNWENSKKFKSDILEADWQSLKGMNEKIILAKPKTYMNNSGLAVQLLTSNFQLLTSDLWVVHDDIDLPLGKIKIRLGGGSAGHRGIESIIKSLGTDKFWRFRLGIGSEKLRNADDFVLEDFTSSEQGKARELIKKGAKAIETALEKELEVAMNRFNTK